MPRPVDSATAIVSLRVHTDLAAWRSIGLTVGADGLARIGKSGLELIDASPAGLGVTRIGSRVGSIGLGR